MSTQVQSVIFEKSKYSVTEAKKWLRDNGFVAPKVDKTDRYLRFRQKEPSYFDESSFRTIPFGKGKGIKAIIGVPMKHNPFFDELDPDGDGHRIGAYAMLFTKAKNEWKRTGDPLELAKAKEYWNQYLDARDRYKTVEDRRGASILLHEMGSFDQAIQNPKQRNNPMKTHKNKAFVEEIRKLSDAKIMQYISATEDQINNEEAYLLSIEDDKAHGTGSFSELMDLQRETEAEIDILKDKIRIMKDLLSVRKKLCKNPMKTHKNPVIEGKTLVENIKGLQALIDKMVKSKTDYGIEDLENAILDVLSKLNMFGVVAKSMRYYPNTGGGYIISLFQSSMGDISLSIHAKSKHQVSAKVNYLDALTLGKKHGGLFNFFKRMFGAEERQDEDSFKGISDFVADMVVKPADLKKYAYVVDGQENGLEELLTQQDMRMNPHCHCYGHKKNPHCPVHGRKKNPYGTAFRHGHMSGLAYRYNPTKKIMSFESFMDNLADGNVFVGRYVIFVQDGVPMRLEVGSSTPKEVSPEVAFYADLAGQAELVGTSDIDAFSDDYRGLIRQASDASSGSVVAGGGVPVVEVEEVEEITYPRFEGEIKGVRPMGARDFVKFTIDEGKLKQFSQDMVIKAHDDFIASYDKFRMALMEGKAESTYGKHLKDATEHLAVILASPQLKSFLSDDRYDVRAQIKKMTGFNKKTTAKTSKGISKYFDQATQYLIKQETGKKAQIVDEDGKRSSIEEVVQDEVDKVEAQGGAAPAPAQGGVDPNQALLDALRSIGEDVSAARKQSEGVQAQFKNNPRASHYAYNMSTLDHNHRMSYVPLNNVYIKKNPSDAFRFPQTKVLGVDIDNDIYTWLSGILPNWDGISQKLEKVKDLAVNVQPVIMDMIINLIQNVASLKASDDQFMVRMQTEIVPAVEEKVKKQLAEGKTLKDIVGKAKKNPRRTRRNTKRRRRYY